MGPHVALPLVERNDLGLDGDRPSDGLGQRLFRRVGPEAVLEALQQRRVRQQAMLEELHRSLPELGVRQRAQRADVGEDRAGLPERARQVLALRQVDGRLAAHAGIDHGQQRGGHLVPGHAALEGGGSEAGEVADHASPHGDHRRGPVEALAREAALQLEPAPGGLAVLACRDLEARHLRPGGGQHALHGVPVERADVRVADERQSLLAHACRQRLQHAGADRDRVGRPDADADQVGCRVLAHSSNLSTISSTTSSDWRASVETVKLATSP